MKKKNPNKTKLGARIVDWIMSIPFVRQVVLFVRLAVRWTRGVTLPGFRRVSIYDFCVAFYQGAKEGTIWQRAKGLSYSMLVAIPPLLIFLFTLIAFFPVSEAQDVILFQLHDIIPARFYGRVAETVSDVMSHRHSSLLSIGFLGSIILATNGIYGCLRSINYANKTVERRPFLPVYGVSMLLVVLLYILVVFVAVLLVGYRLIINWLISRGMVADTPITMFFIQLGRWLILVALTLCVLSVVYYFAQGKTLVGIFRKKDPSKPEKPGFGFFAPGSLLATSLIFVLSWAMQIYLNNFNRSNLLYGSIGTLLMIMFWIFLNCWVLLIGYEINVSIVGGLLHHKYSLVERGSLLRGKSKGKKNKEKQ